MRWAVPLATAGWTNQLQRASCAAAGRTGLVPSTGALVPPRGTPHWALPTSTRGRHSCHTPSISSPSVEASTRRDDPGRSTAPSAEPTLGVAEALSVAANGVRIVAPGPLWVQGEVEGFVQSRAGHWYWSLTGDGARLPACCLGREAASVGAALARAQVKLGDGLTVRVRGSLGVYSPRGQVQLRVFGDRPRGFGGRRCPGAPPGAGPVGGRRPAGAAASSASRVVPSSCRSGGTGRAGPRARSTYAWARLVGAVGRVATVPARCGRRERDRDRVPAPQVSYPRRSSRRRLGRRVRPACGSRPLWRELRPHGFTAAAPVRALVGQLEEHIGVARDRLA